MKNKTGRVIAFIVAVILIAGVGWFANAIVGNPVSKAMAKSTAKKYLKTTYSGTDYYIEEISYSFKDCNYYADIKSPSSMDTEFSFAINMAGKLLWDNYEGAVLSKQNTADRLYMEYRKLVDTVLESPMFPFDSDIGYGDLQFVEAAYVGAEGIPSYAIVTEELELDGFYDIAELGRQAGLIVIYFYDEEVTEERAAEILLEFKELMDDGGVPFYAIDMVLEYPRTEDGNTRPDARVEIDGFLYEDIYEEGLAERVRAAAAEAEE